MILIKNQFIYDCNKYKLIVLVFKDQINWIVKSSKNLLLQMTKKLIRKSRYGCLR